MTEENQKNPLAAMTGQKFLYQQPEVLTLEDHGSLGITPNERPFDFVKDERAIPLTMVEISSAQRHYPIIFSNLEDPVPMAVLGLPVAAMCLSMSRDSGTRCVMSLPIFVAIPSLLRRRVTAVGRWCSIELGPRSLKRRASHSSSTASPQQR